MFIDGTGRFPRHKCETPGVSDAKIRHGAIWWCLEGKPVCGKYWRFNESDMKWEKLSPKHLAWWKHTLF